MKIYERVLKYDVYRVKYNINIKMSRGQKIELLELQSVCVCVRVRVCIFVQ